MPCRRQISYSFWAAPPPIDLGEDTVAPSMLVIRERRPSALLLANDTPGLASAFFAAAAGSKDLGDEALRVALCTISL
jgi:hypothetical protein